VISTTDVSNPLIVAAALSAHHSGKGQAMQLEHTHRSMSRSDGSHACEARDSHGSMAWVNGQWTASEVSQAVSEVGQ